MVTWSVDMEGDSHLDRVTPRAQQAPQVIPRDEAHLRHCWKDLKREPKSNLHDARAKVAAHFGIANVVGIIARPSRRRQRAAKQIDSAPLRVVEGIEGLPPEL
jgi:hypothetical protein